MGNMQDILQSFNQQDNLNPKFWRSPKEKTTKDHNGQNSKLKPEIRNRLLEIAYEFINFLDVDIIVADVIMTGSLSNYNWSKYSDVDLHIVADFNQFPKEQLPLYEELFRLKKTIYNDKHDIKIYGYDVEVYVQDESESHFSSGVYSIFYDKWVVNPKKENVKIDKKLIKSKVKQWMNIIDDVIENAKDEPIDTANKLIKKYKDKLKKYRTCGLEKGGEYSDENIVFKILRRNGYIEKLYKFQDKHQDKLLSLNEAPQAVNQSLYPNIKFEDGVVGNSRPSKDKIEPTLLDDIQTAAKNVGAVVSITTAVSGHKAGTRHESGHAVDISKVNGQGFSGGESDADRKGILDDINKFVDELVKLGYTKNSESGNDKAVLTFGFDGHDNHIHVSKKSESPSQYNDGGTSSGTTSSSDNKLLRYLSSTFKEIMPNLK